ncbi:MAG: acetyl-CoA carboxylase biotin carboxylase subunit [Oscillospiraceae bacterium]|nr:acetyl-CoA carboxylase biotin carboxylase subunit [Oscillospiraceae bacterium]
MFSKILVANRGEIAIRIIRACKEMGIETVAVYSTADAESLHVALADQSICIGGNELSGSYLNANAIVSAALITGAQAIHPGYGFLSENADFAQLCAQHNLVFIGPSADVIALAGDKEQSKRVMQTAGVPVIPGSSILADLDSALAAADEIGYPVLVKARSGGGGRGIRLVKQPSEMQKAYQAAIMEAESAFGDGAVYLEKFISPAHHVEVQLLADEDGNVVCLGERECSIQKHNQKLLEETPSPNVSAETRKHLFDAGIRAAKAVGYVNAGTVEFLMDETGNFYYMEMNVRLQVEHAITELVTGIDLAKWQIRIASGVPLDYRQENIIFRGHSIECRINAKASGRVNFLHIPGGPFVRFDTCLWDGYTVPPYYDSMLGKLVVQAGTREEAVRKMRAALCELVIDGVPNNIEDQIEIIDTGSFQAGTYNLNFFKEAR